MSIQELVDNDAIRFFNFDGNIIDLADVPLWEIDDETVNLSLTTKVEERIAQLEALYVGENFQPLISAFTPDCPLWIGITMSSNVALGDLLPPGSFGGGLVVVSDAFEFGFVDQNGDVQENTFKRVFSHELNHAATGLPDTNHVLDGSSQSFQPNRDLITPPWMRRMIFPDQKGTKPLLLSWQHG